MTLLLTILIVLVCILLTLVVLVQNPKGGGLGSAFGGGNAQMFGGVKKTTDFLDRSTWTLAISLFVLVLAINVFNIGGNSPEASDIEDMTEQVDGGLEPVNPEPVTPDENLPESVEE